jgi:cell wall-associated NlpC family hydrolase
MVTMSKREEFLRWCEAQVGSPYVWGGKGKRVQVDDEWVFIYDCSGLVTSGFLVQGLPDWRVTHNADLLHKVLEPIEAKDAKPGDLVFYGKRPGYIDHVMVLCDGGRVLGACGGNSATKRVIDAIRLGARVRYRESVDYRPDLRGYRRSPLD